MGPHPDLQSRIKALFGNLFSIPQWSFDAEKTERNRPAVNRSCRLKSEMASPHKSWERVDDFRMAPDERPRQR
jgi:hypothetical protein